MRYLYILKISKVQLSVGGGRTARFVLQLKGSLEPIQNCFYSSSGTELPLVFESYGLLNDIFPFPSILDAGYPSFNLHLPNVLFDVILPSVLGSSL